MGDFDEKLSPKEKKIRNTLDKVFRTIILALNEGKGVHLELDCKDEQITIKTTLSEKTKLS